LNIDHRALGVSSFGPPHKQRYTKDTIKQQTGDPAKTAMLEADPS